MNRPPHTAPSRLNARARRIEHREAHLPTPKLDFTTARAADGPKLVAWLEEREDLTSVRDPLRKQLRRWRGGQQASFWRVDAALVHFGRLPSELPDDVWVEYDNGRRKVAA
jgi:hypothetical protein